MPPFRSEANSGGPPELPDIFAAHEPIWPQTAEFLNEVLGSDEAASALGQIAASTLVDGLMNVYDHRFRKLAEPYLSWRRESSAAIRAHLNGASIEEAVNDTRLPPRSLLGRIREAAKILKSQREHFIFLEVTISEPVLPVYSQETISTTIEPQAREEHASYTMPEESAQICEIMTQEDASPEESSLQIESLAQVLAGLRAVARSRKQAMIRMAPTRDAQEVAILIDWANTSDDHFIKCVNAKTLQLFVSMVKTCGERGVLERPLSTIQWQQLAELFLTDLKLMKEQYGIYNPVPVALYNGIDQVEQVWAACRANPLLAEKRYLQWAFKNSPRDPLGALQNLSSTLADFRTVHEPAIRAEFDYIGEWSDKYLLSLALQHNLAEYLRKQCENRILLQKTFPYASSVSIEAVLKNAHDRHKAGWEVISWLNEPPEIVNLTEEIIECGHRTFAQFLSDRPGAGAYNITHWTWEKHRLASRLLANSHLYEGTNVDMVWAVHNIGLLFKDKLSLELGAPVFRAYVENTIAFAEQGLSKPSELAKYVTPQQFEQLKATHNTVLGLSEEALGAVIIKNASPERKLETMARLFADIRNEYGSVLKEAEIRRLIIRTNGVESTALRRARAAAHGTEICQSIQRDYPWVTERHIRSFCLESDTPEVSVRTWADQSERAFKQFGQLDFVTEGVCRSLMHNHKNQTVAEVMQMYQARVKDLYATARQAHVALPKFFIIQWASRFALKPDEVVKHHREHMLDCDAHLRAEGVVVSDEVLQLLAFHWPHKDQTSNTIHAYLHRVRTLERELEFNVRARKELIELAAAGDANMKWVRERLSWLMYLETLGTSDIGNRPESNAGEEMRATRQLPLAQDWQQALNPLEVAALQYVFGLSADYSEEQLLADLAIDSLEPFVYEVVLPKVKDFIAKRESSESPQPYA